MMPSRVTTSESVLVLTAGTRMTANGTASISNACSQITILRP